MADEYQELTFDKTEGMEQFTFKIDLYDESHNVNIITVHKIQEALAKIANAYTQDIKQQKSKDKKKSKEEKEIQIETVNLYISSYKQGCLEFGLFANPETVSFIIDGLYTFGMTASGTAAGQFIYDKIRSKKRQKTISNGIYTCYQAGKEDKDVKGLSAGRNLEELNAYYIPRKNFPSAPDDNVEYKIANGEVAKLTKVDLDGNEKAWNIQIGFESYKVDIGDKTFLTLVKEKHIQFVHDDTIKADITYEIHKDEEKETKKNFKIKKVLEFKEKPLKEYAPKIDLGNLSS